MKYLALIPLVFVASCASRPQLAFRPLPSPAVGPVEAVRYGEVVRAYHVGRYVDPNHPETMQEAAPGLSCRGFRALESSSWPGKRRQPAEPAPRCRVRAAADQ